MFNLKFKHFIIHRVKNNLMILKTVKKKSKISCVPLFFCFITNIVLNKNK